MPSPSDKTRLLKEGAPPRFAPNGRKSSLLQQARLHRVSFDFSITKTTGSTCERNEAA
jgi:hypothetical protein